MGDKITQVVWTRQARESLNSILDYSYKAFLQQEKLLEKIFRGRHLSAY